MEYIDFILHIDIYLETIIQNYGLLTYVFIFLLIFCETGLVVTPFLPGDSLIFMIGALAAGGTLNVYVAFILLLVAAVTGNLVNYQIGRLIGKKAFSIKDSAVFKQEYLEKTEDFYEKYGAMAIIVGRFLVIIRTFVPFVAGVGKMNPKKFFVYNFVGGLSWVSLFLFGGYFFGNLAVIKDNFSLVVAAIIIISFVPMIYVIFSEQGKRKKRKRKTKEEKSFTEMIIDEVKEEAKGE